MHYTLKDHQGSLTATVHGNTVKRLSYDAWGRRRNPIEFGYSNVSCTFYRGYTLHEHYDDFGLVNMNGRMYDPVMSSFLSVDAFVDDPYTAQGFNRYAYCMHNPLRYTDPSGWRKQGREPTSGNYEHWSMRYAVPLYEPRDYQNPYYLYNQSFFGNYEGIMCEGGGSFGGGGTASYGFESSYGYYATHYANSVYNYCFPSSQLQLIRNWQDNPCYRTNLDLREAGISGLTVGVVCGQINGESGYRYSCYQWSNDKGNTYSTALFDYVGGSANEYYSMSNQPLRMYGNPNYSIAGGLLSIGSLYTSVEASLHYNETIGFWRGKNGKFYGLNVNGNRYTGGKLKYGKAVSNGFKRASAWLGVAGMGISALQCAKAETSEDKIRFGADVIIGGIGLAPGGVIISSFWFFGGRELVFNYGENIGELMKDGINPGLPVNQPFK